MPLPSCPGNTMSANQRPPPHSRPDNTTGVVPLVAMAWSPSSRWLRRPRRAGVVVVHRSPSSHWRSSRWRHPCPRLSGERIILSCLFGEKILSSAPFLLSGNYRFLFIPLCKFLRLQIVKKLGKVTIICKRRNSLSRQLRPVVKKLRMSQL